MTTTYMTYWTLLMITSNIYVLDMQEICSTQKVWGSLTVTCWLRAVGYNQR